MRALKIGSYYKYEFVAKWSKETVTLYFKVLGREKRKAFSDASPFVMRLRTGYLIKASSTLGEWLVGDSEVGRNAREISALEGMLKIGE